MNVTQICIGRFHHFHLARQLEKHGLLNRIYTGYPHFKLRDEAGIPKDKIRSFPWLHTPYMFRSRIGLSNFAMLNKWWYWAAHDSLDRFVASRLHAPGVLVSLSSTGLHAGTKIQGLGGVYICDRGSSHINYQDELLREEHARWSIPFAGIDKKIIHKEQLEYHQADAITVPSEFVRQSFVSQGVSPDKLHKVPYGARLERFSRTQHPLENRFRILWVGAITIRKGFMYLLKAFQRFSHPNKELLVIGNVSAEVKSLLNGESLEHIRFMGQVANASLPDIYSSSHVFVLSSIEEGLAMVQGEAMACGCPVIATQHTGAEDLITDGIEGFVVPIRSAEDILARLQQLADEPYLRDQLGENALEKVKSLGGWDHYGSQYTQVIKSLTID